MVSAVCAEVTNIPTQQIVKVKIDRMVGIVLRIKTRLKAYRQRTRLGDVAHPCSFSPAHILIKNVSLKLYNFPYKTWQ